MAIATIETLQSRSLPRAIKRGLGRVKHRLRAAGAMRGLGKAAIVLAVGAALAMAADVTFPLPSLVRWMIWVVWIGTAAIATVAGVVRPLLRRLNWNDLAALAERGEPSLGERLTSAVGLLHQPHGSPELVAAVVNDATERAGHVDLTRAVSMRGALAWLMTGAVAAALSVLPAVMKPDPFAQIGKRFLLPWAGINRVGRFAIEVSPGDQFVTSGSDVSLSAAVRSRFGQAIAPDEAWLEWSGTDGTPNRVKMAAGALTTRGERTFTMTLPRLTGSVTYRALAGGDASRRHLIKAVDPPAIASLKAHIEPPSYTKRIAAPARDPARIEAWEDSRVTLSIEASKSLKQAELIWPAMAKQEKSTSELAASRVVALAPGDDGKRWSATVVAGASGPFAIRLRDEYDLENKPDEALRVVVRPDTPPTLVIAAPDEFKETSATDYLSLTVAVRDDVSVASAELHYTIERGRGSTGPMSGSVIAPLEGLGTPVARGAAALSLAKLALKPGDVISYRVRVADNRPAPRGPNITWSAAHLLRIIEHSESLQARQQTAERDAQRARLEGIQKAVMVTRQGLDQVRSHADAVRRGNAAWDETKAKDIADREAKARGVSDELRSLARDLEQNAAFQPLARPARQVAEVEGEAARAALEATRRATDPAKRLTELDRAALTLATLTWKVDTLKQKFDELARLSEDRHRLGELAQTEDDLATRTDQAAASGDRPKLDALAEEQERLRHELDEVLKRSPSLRAEALAAQAREAHALAARARTLAEHQREEARRTADDRSRSAAVKALAEKQRALEDDARRLAVRLDEPLSQNGRGRLDANVLARTGESIERGDLDGARDRALDAENTLNRLAREVEDVRNDPKALARRLVQRQEVLKSETAEAVRTAREHPPQTPEGKAALFDRLKPLIERQESISQLAAAIPAPPAQKGAARDATQKTATARDDLREVRPRDVEGHQNEARDALNRLADALPDANQRRDQARQKLGEARSRFEEIARDLDNQLRETAPKPGQPFDAAKSAAELAQRVAPLARREREVAEALAAIDPETRAGRQRDRAARRAVEFANALETLRQQAPSVALTPPEDYRPVVDWRVVGPFPIGNKPPFATDVPADVNQKHNDRKGQPASWQSVKPANDKGAIDLASHYSTRDNGIAAFGYAELKSTTTRQARMLIGSNDTFTIWLNGKQVYDSQVGRSWASDHARIDVPLEGGTNRIVVKCGNTGGNWMYSVAVSIDPARPKESQADELANAKPPFERLREALPAFQVAARSALDRFQQKLDGQQPPDDLAEELAKDQRDLKAAETRTPVNEAAARAELAADQCRIANALSNLEAPDVPLAKAEAVRSARAAARALEAPANGDKPVEAGEAIARATDSATALARRLTDDQPSRERARDLARAQQMLVGPRAQSDAADQARQQRAIADELARLPVENKQAAAKAVAQAAELSDQAARFDAGPRPDAATLDKAREQAARQLDKLAATTELVPTAPPRDAPEQTDARLPEDPALGLTPADRADATALAQRQRHIRESLQAILGDAAASQRTLREQSNKLGRELGDLRDRAREMSQRAQWPAQTAADLLGRAAPEMMERAATGLNRGRPADALGAQRQAADLAEQGARHAEDLAAAFRADRPPGTAETASSDLATAQAAVRSATQKLSEARGPAQSQAEAAQATRAAAAAMHEAAQGLRSVDRSTRGPAPARKPATTSNDPSGMPADLGGPDLNGLKAAVRAKTGRTWGELPGHLRTEILQMSQGQYRDDYARLIELYFRELATDAADRGTTP